MVERLIENYVGELDADITSTDLSLTLTADPGTALPSTGEHRIRLSDVAQTVEEVIWVTGRSGAVLSWPDTAHRGVEDPTGVRPAADWPAGSVVESIWTAGAQALWLAQNPPAHSATTGQTANDHHAQVHGNADHTTTGTPSTQAFADTAAAGSSASVARIDHKHAMPTSTAGPDADVTTDAAGAAGTANTAARSGHGHKLTTSSAAASTSAVADSATAGTAGVSRADHKHGRESFGATTAQTSYGASSGNGTATTPARSDHVHGTVSHDAHGSLTGVSADQHHTQAHALSSADHTGAITDAQHGVRTTANAHGHAQLSGVTADQHHAESHDKAAHSAAAIPGTANESLGAHFLDVAGVVAPASPTAGTRRVFTDSGTGQLSVRTSGGTTVSLEGGGGGGGTIDNTDADYKNVSTTTTHGSPATGLAADAAHQHAHPSGLGVNLHHNQSHGHTGADSSGTVAHSATTGRTVNDHHNQAHNLRSADHPDVSTSAPADGQVLTWNASTSKWGPAAGGGVGFVHTPDKGVDHQYVDPFRGSSSNQGTSPGDAMPTLQEASQNLTTHGNGTIDICAGRYNIDETSLDYTDFYHKAQLIVRGAGMRKGDSGGTEINWTGGDGTRVTGTVTASATATSLTALTGTVNHNASPTSSNDDRNHLIRIAGAGYGGADLVTWILTTTDTTHFTILDPIITAVTGAAWTVYRPKFLWMCGARDWSTSWGSQGGLQDIMFNVDGNLPIASATHRDNLVFVGVVNGQNGAWFDRVRCGDKDDDGTGSGVEKFRDGLFGIYAFSANVAGQGAGGLGYNYLRDLWLMGSEYGLITALSANPVVLSGASNSGKYGRAQIYIARGGNPTSNLQIPYWKSELRDRYISNPYAYGTDLGNPDDSAGGVPFFFDIACPKIVLDGGIWSVQQESGAYSRGAAVVPNIPAIRFQPTENLPLVNGRIYGTRFNKAFSAVNQGTTYDESFPGGVGARAVKIDFWP